MSTNAALHRHRSTVAAWPRVLGILSLIVAAACSSDPSSTPAASSDDSGLDAEIAQPESSTDTAAENTAAQADVRGDRFDIDESTTMREVFDTFLSDEQDCIRESGDHDLLEAVLGEPMVSDDERVDRFWKPVASCVEPATAKELFISALVADADAWTKEEGASADASKEIRRSCLRRLLADVNVAAWLSETESGEQTLEDDDLLAALFACGLDLEMEWTFSDADADADADTDTDCDCEATNGECDVTDCEGEITIKKRPETTEPDDAGKDTETGTGNDDTGAGVDDHSDDLDGATHMDDYETVPGAIDHDGDIDFFVFWAEAGTTYEIDVALETLPDSIATLYDDRAYELDVNDDDYGYTTASRIVWRADYTGNHFVAVESFDASTGTYYLTVTPDVAGFDDHADDLDWATSIGLNEATLGAIDHEDDVDVFVFWAEWDTTYQIDVALGTLRDSTATLYDHGAVEIAFNDDYTDNGDWAASRIIWQADYTGSALVAVESFDGSTGTYTLTVTPHAAGSDDDADDLPETVAPDDGGNN